MALELSRNIVIGQYIPGDTLVHRLDPRTKILCTSFLLFGMTFTRSLAVSLAYLVVGGAARLLAHIPLDFVLRPFIRGLPYHRLLSDSFCPLAELAGTDRRRAL